MSTLFYLLNTPVILLINDINKLVEQTTLLFIN
jgi:hypothetical protein